SLRERHLQRPKLPHRRRRRLRIHQQRLRPQLPPRRRHRRAHTVRKISLRLHLSIPPQPFPPTSLQLLNLTPTPQPHSNSSTSLQLLNLTPTPQPHSNSSTSL